MSPPRGVRRTARARQSPVAKGTRGARCTRADVPFPRRLEDPGRTPPGNTRPRPSADVQRSSFLHHPRRPRRPGRGPRGGVSAGVHLRGQCPCQGLSEGDKGALEDPATDSSGQSSLLRTLLGLVVPPRLVGWYGLASPAPALVAPGREGRGLSAHAVRLRSSCLWPAGPECATVLSVSPAPCGRAGPTAGSRVRAWALVRAEGHGSPLNSRRRTLLLAADGRAVPPSVPVRRAEPRAREVRGRRLHQLMGRCPLT